MTHRKACFDMLVRTTGANSILQHLSISIQEDAEINVWEADAGLHILPLQMQYIQS